MEGVRSLLPPCCPSFLFFSLLPLTLSPTILLPSVSLPRERVSLRSPGCPPTPLLLPQFPQCARPDTCLLHTRRRVPYHACFALAGCSRRPRGLARPSPRPQRPRTRLRVTRPRPARSCFPSRREAGRARRPPGRAALSIPADPAAAAPRPPGRRVSEPPGGAGTPLLALRRRRPRRLLGGGAGRGHAPAGAQAPPPAAAPWETRGLRTLENFIWGLSGSTGWTETGHACCPLTSVCLQSHVQNKHIKTYFNLF